MEKLLAKPVFQRHMTAVREVLNMLRAAQKLRSSGEPCDERAIKVRSPPCHNRAFCCSAWVLKLDIFMGMGLLGLTRVLYP